MQHAGTNSLVWQVIGWHLLQFQTRSLLLYLVKQWNMAKCLGPCTQTPARSFWLGLAQPGSCSELQSEQTDGCSLLFSPFLTQQLFQITNFQKFLKRTNNTAKYLIL